MPSEDDTPAHDAPPVETDESAREHTVCAIDSSEYDRPTVIIANVETDEEWVQMPEEHTIPESEWE